MAIFARKTIPVESLDVFFIFGDRNSMKGDDENTLPCNAQCITALAPGGKKISICNAHGMPEWPKTDNPARLKQSKIIKNFLGRRENVKILCGDLNLLPETKSIQMLEKDMRNLVNEFEVKDTRGKLHQRDPHVSDYVFISKDIAVLNFSAPDMGVSDHLPLILDFSIS